MVPRLRMDLLDCAIEIIQAPAMAYFPFHFISTCISPLYHLSSVVPTFMFDRSSLTMRGIGVVDFRMVALV